MSESVDTNRVILIAVAVLIIGMAIGSNLPGLSIHGPPEPYSTNVKIFFSTHASCASEVIRLINGSNSTIYIATYSFTNQDIANALIRAASRGISIKIIGEPTQRMQGNMYSVLQRNSSITVIFTNRSGMQHDTFMVVDGVYVTTGSFYWTRDSEAINSENMLSMVDRSIATIYKSEWDWLLLNRTG